MANDQQRPEFADALADFLFQSCEDQSLQEQEELLQEYGVDLDGLSQRLQALVAKQQGLLRLRAAGQKYERIVEAIKATPHRYAQRAADLLGRLGAQDQTAVQAWARKFESAREEDYESLCEDLEDLLHLQENDESQ